MRAPDLAEPIVAWRSWCVVKRREGARLAGLVYPTVWEPRREIVCSCLATPRWAWPLLRRRRPAHDAPDAGCTCGIYAASDPALAGRYYFATDIDRRDDPTRVIGLVSLWGRVLECRRGWRAQFAYPLRIFVPRNRFQSERQAVELALDLACYGTPIEVVSYLRERDLVESIA